MKIENDQYKEKDMGALFQFAANGVAAQHAVDDITKNYHKGNEMSVQANKKPDKAGQRLKIMNILERGIFTCEEVEDITLIPHQSCSARISELRRDGLIQKIGVGTTQSGCNAATYTVASHLSTLAPTTANP